MKERASNGYMRRSPSASQRMRVQDMKTSDLLGGDTYQEAMKWEQAGEGIRIGQKIRVTFQGLGAKSGYAYREEGAWLGIRYTWKSMRWWSLLSYNNPLNKLEVQELTGEGKPYWVTLWEKEGKQ